MGWGIVDRLKIIEIEHEYGSVAAVVACHCVDMGEAIDPAGTVQCAGKWIQEGIALQLVHKTFGQAELGMQGKRKGQRGQARADLIGTPRYAERPIVC